MAGAGTYINGKTGNIEAVELTAVPTSFENEAAVRAYLATLVSELLESELFTAAS